MRTVCMKIFGLTLNFEDIVYGGSLSIDVILNHTRWTANLSNGLRGHCALILVFDIGAHIAMLGHYQKSCSVSIIENLRIVGS